jgi:photosystem II stability/assembly factor-like uncharacterized protein
MEKGGFHLRLYAVFAPIIIAGLFLQSYMLNDNLGLDSSMGTNTAELKTNMNSLQGYPAKFSMNDIKHGWGIDETGLWTTNDGGSSWYHPDSNIVPIPQETGIFAAASFFLNATNGWIISSHGMGQPVLIYHTSDQGQTWKETKLPVTEDWEQGYSGGFIHFIDVNNGYVLLDSEPGLGMMEKSLYRTADGGNSWKRIGNLTGSIKAYPTGITFQDSQNGWITSSNHGQEYILTFRTKDGGKSWKPEQLKKPAALAAFTYSNSYPPKFSGKDNMKGILPLEIVDDGIRSMVFYTSDNGGRTWKLGPQLLGTEAARTTWLNAREGWALQEGGKLVATVNGGVSWRLIATSQLFAKAENIQFVTPKNGWLAGPGFLQTTTDGGVTWKPLVSKP